MATITRFRDDLKAAILERHCANHPMTDKWARGELGREALMGWGVEHWHWVSNIHDATFYRCAGAPRDVQLAMLGNWGEETDETRPHMDIVLRFAAANGANIEEEVPAAGPTGAGRRSASSSSTGVRAPNTWPSSSRARCTPRLSRSSARS